MAGSTTNFLRPLLLGHSLGYNVYEPPAAVYVGLTRTLPSAAFRGTEVVGGGYLRMLALFGSTGDPRAAANTGDLQWPTATADWGTIGWFELWDDAFVGNRLYWGELVSPIDLVSPQTVQILAGATLLIPSGHLFVEFA